MKRFTFSLSFIPTCLFLATNTLIAQNVGIGNTAPKTLLHISKGATGITPHSLAPLTLESTSNNYLQFLSVANKEAGLLFGNPTGIAQGGIVYNNPGNLEGLDFRTNGNIVRMTIDNNGKLDLIGDLRLRGSNPANGATLVSKDVNGNTAWQRAYAFKVEGLLNEADLSAPNTAKGKILFNGIAAYNIGLTYVPGLSEFTVPVKGIYNFSAQVSAYKSQTTAIPGSIEIRLMRKRTGITEMLKSVKSSVWVVGSNSNVSLTSANEINGDFILEPNDVIWLEYYTFTDHIIYGAKEETSFSGRLVTQLY